jgi:hypothetical protein
MPEDAPASPEPPLPDHVALTRDGTNLVLAITSCSSC